MAHINDDAQLTPDQIKQCLATGAPISEILDLHERGFEFADILGICESAQTARNSDKDGDAERQAKATKKAMRPENEFHPGKGVFSRPAGERDDPKGDLVCKTLWAGTQEEATTLTPEELDLLNTLPVGTYRCTRSDGAPIKVEVSVKSDEMGKPELRSIFFPTRGGLRHNLPSKVVMLREMHAQARVASPA
jgi:hypothetical protein